MGKTIVNTGSVQPPVWVAGFSLEDFMVPSVKAEVAIVAQAVTRAVIDLAPIANVIEETIDAVAVTQVEAVGSETIFEQVLKGWGEVEADAEDEFGSHASAWPTFDPEMFRPEADSQKRIEDNISAIRLVNEIATQCRPIEDHERAALLKYCGWGGLARVFSPDGSKPHVWSAYREELKTVTTEREFNGMQASVNTAFFTSPSLVTAMWTLVKRLGFKGGKVLEPSAGNGLFLAAMPPELAKKSEITAVELDAVTAKMLEANFSNLGVQVQAGALEDARLPAGQFDLVIGNSPFGDFKSMDTSSAPYAQWSIHNYFLGKSVDLVRPGGLIVMVTSRHAMDSKSQAHRKWLAAHTDLVGAIRLPTMAFKDQAQTEAVTDIVVLQRRAVPDYTREGWTNLANAHETMLAPGQSKFYVSQGRSLPRNYAINSYYTAHPKMVMGLMEFQSGQYGESLNPVFKGSMQDLEAKIIEAIESLPEGIYTPVRATSLAPESGMRRINANSYVQPGSFLVHDGRICVSEGDELLDVDNLFAGTARMRMLGMIDIKRHAQEVIEFQAKSKDDVQLAALQRLLSGSYDSFVSKCGYISTVANSRVMRTDPEWPLLLALEVWDEEEQKAKKADIFSMRTVGHTVVPEHVDSVKDAMLISLGLYGKIVLKDMTKRTSMPVVALIQQMEEQGLAYRDPSQGQWVPADEYLSGNIRDKIRIAEVSGAHYMRNVQALQQVLPRDLGPLDVEARLGAPWIPTDVIASFATELVNAKSEDVTVSYDAQTASWSVKTNSWRMEYSGEYALQTITWGTKKRCAFELLEGALNQTPPTITVEIDGRRVVDRMATLAVRDKWQAIKDKFRQWVFQDSERRDRILGIYNEQFNQIVPRRFDGSHMMLPGMSMALVPRDHQLSAIWRIVTAGNTLLAHCVGAGKTLVMCAASMELRRLGRSTKPLHVVQNSCLEQYAAEFKRLYPQAKILIASKDDLSGDKRRAFVARIACGDWDGIVMTQATFERLMLSPVVQQTFMDKMLAEARAMSSIAEDRGAKRSVKEIEKRVKDWEAKIKRLVESNQKDDTSVWFDELGIDMTLIDEAHSYKNLAKLSKMPRIAGLSNAASQRAFDVFMKTRYIMGLHGDKEFGVVMATATPLSNSLAELHTFQVYLQPQTLKRFGLYEFDAWSASFGESVTGVELAPDGSGYRMNTRYCRFVNMPELMNIFRGVADIKTKTMLKLPTPTLVGGKPQTMVATPSDTQIAMVQSFVERAEKVRGGVVKPDEDNMLKITSDGRKAALDVRLMDPHLPFEPGCKLDLAVQNMLRIYRDGSDMRVTQLVFSDLGTPSGTGFNVYAEVKRLLMLGGVPEEEIAFIHDHNTDKARAKLFARVRQGAIRFMLGSTSMMGTGTNVQTLVKAVHQLDGPWRPSDVEQRDGRGERQGNLNDSIELWRYVTSGTFDAYTWNTLSVKAAFIEQAMTSDASVRSVEDVSMTALTYAEIKAIASGNPLVLEKTTVDAQVHKLSLKRSMWEDDRWQLDRRVTQLLARLQWIDANMANAESEAKMAATVAQDSNTVFIPAAGLSSKAVLAYGNGAESIGAAFRAHVAAQVLTYSPSIIGSVGDFEVGARRSMGNADILVRGPHSNHWEDVSRPNMDNFVGVGSALLKTITDLVDRPAEMRMEYASKTNELATTRQLQQVPFKEADQLDELLKRQREIESQLDLDKSAAGTEAMAEQTA